MYDEMLTSWQGLLIGVLGLICTILASAHAVLNKRDVRAAIGWVGFIWVAPLVGPVAYVLLGVNRIQRRAVALRRGTAGERPADEVESPAQVGPREDLRRLVDALVARRLAGGNRIEPLSDGNLAFERMLAAIAGAGESVALSTYIFDRDQAGRDFADALTEAVGRNVRVRVLIDALGDRYTFPPMRWELRRRGIRVAHFLPTRWPWRMPYVNLRNHRKLLVVDGRLAYTGGMNIRQGHRREAPPRRRIVDLHFEIEGPVVEQLQEVFAEDWQFATGERLEGAPWFPPLEASGETFARSITDGPDEDLDKIRWTLLGALACAQRRVVIVTPYFLPQTALSTALEVTARRGVTVDIVLPEVNNLRLVHWASRAGWEYLVAAGCRLWLSPPPFDHTKLMLVDEEWAFIGSANWDPRSLRLNFELNLDCHGPLLVEDLDRLAAEKLRRARRITLEELHRRSLPMKLVDATARLLSPYL